ncbi:tetratricopeptide repeat-containing glycosyltransferase family 2 protein [Paenibacillus jiagnxiensis]|uniref:tetratricopeptide repeat-containing glycosyltransferase family 2 protein n=1 Tax=Paenibacillus jiagnxiensis TaxID=3228926 RepID=UPI0033BBE86C
MITISLCMIVKDEEHTIEACLRSVQDIVDEINIVDTGSQDRTSEICRQYTDRIFPFTWTDHFAEARNYAFDQATKEYILWLDADDVFEEEDARKLKELKHSLDPQYQSVSMIYNVGFDGHGNVTLSYRRNRLVKRSAGFRWVGAVHEYLAVAGPIYHADIAVTHKHKHLKSGNPRRNLDIYEKQIALGHPLPPRDRYYYANELRDNGMYQQAAENYQLFLDTNACWDEDAIAACDKMASCYEMLGQKEMSVEAGLNSLKYDSPRAELCCRMGRYHMERNEVAKAARWYTLATEIKRPETMGFFQDAYWTWVPHIQLCICHYKLGDYVRSHEHNEKAAEYIPSDPSVLHNRKLLLDLLSNSQPVTKEES